MMYLTSNLLVDSHRFFSAFLPELSNKVNVYLLAYWSGPNIALMLTSGELTMIGRIYRKCHKQHVGSECFHFDK